MPDTCACHPLAGNLISGTSLDKKKLLVQDAYSRNLNEALHDTHEFWVTKQAILSLAHQTDKEPECQQDG